MSSKYIFCSLFHVFSDCVLIYKEPIFIKQELSWYAARLYSTHIETCMKHAVHVPNEGHEAVMSVLQSCKQNVLTFSCFAASSSGS